MGEENDRTLWVGNLSDDITEELLYELFLQAGPLERVTLPKDKSGTGKKRGFAFICFHHDVSVPYAYNLMNGMNLCGRPLRLQYRPGSSHEGSSKSSQSSTPQTPNSHRDSPNYLNNSSDMPSFQQQQAQMLLLQQQQVMMVQQHLGRWGANINFNGRNPDQNLTSSQGGNFSRGDGTSRGSRSEFNTPKLDRHIQYDSRSSSDNWKNQRNQRSNRYESSSSDNSDSQNYRDREKVTDRHGDYNSRDRRDSMRPSSRHSNYGYSKR